MQPLVNLQRNADIKQLNISGWAWAVMRPSINEALTQEISKHEQPAVLATLAREKIACYGDSVHIYTDASKIRKTLLMRASRTL
jgi:hypothetical protein